jgi:RNA polymerase sigma-70 factor (ECF subfamily)
MLLTKCPHHVIYDLVFLTNPETVQLIRAALKHLPPDERAIITMFYYEEMSLKDIAYVTESIPTTVASKLSRTRKKLCKIIKMLQS